MDIDRFQELPLLGILRGIEASMIDPIVELSVAAGLSAMEITMNTEGAPTRIAEMVRAADGRLMREGRYDRIEEALRRLVQSYRNWKKRREP